jgi:uncharacterized repeat protein (TIGR01451 family)
MVRTFSLRAAFFAVLATPFVLSLLCQSTVAQATIHVTTTAQGNTYGAACSLQEAMYSAEFANNIAIDSTDPDHNYTTACEPGTGSGDIIVLENKTYQFNALWDGDSHNPFGPTATPIIFKTMTIQGNGAKMQWTGAGNVRLFAVGYASLTFSSQSGVVTSGTYSGTGNLTLQHVYVKGFRVKGGNGVGGGGGGLGAGGAIYVGVIPKSETPVLTVQNSTFESNGATGGNGGDGLFGGGGGLNGNGGHSTYPAVGGGGGGGSRGDGGAGGLNGCFGFRCESGGGGGGTVYSGKDAVGGDIYVGSFPGPGGYLCGGSGGGPGVIHNGYVTNVDGITPDPTNCPGGGGGGGAYNDYFLGGTGSGGGGSYGGGGGGGPAGGGVGGFGGGGGGGACDCSEGGGSGGFGGGGGIGAGSVAFGGHGATGNGAGGGGGGAALGGAIFNDRGTVLIQNSTFFDNYVSRGLASGGNSDNGGDSGGAIFSRNGSLTVQNATISGNQATGSGGGIVVMNDGAATAFTLDNTIVVNNGANECIIEGSVTTTNSAANLIANNSGCPNVTVLTDPQLDSLKLNSPGDTPTMAISSASSAFDTGDDNTALGTDQRNVHRPQNVHSDIGAYEVVLAADLSVTKTVSSSTAQPGDTITYTIVVRNAGPDPANGVTVSDSWPSSLTFVSCTATNGGNCSYGGSAVSVTYSSLAVNESETITIQGTLSASAQDGLTVANTANVSASSPADNNTGDNSATASFIVHNRADLAVSKTVSTSSPYAPQVEVGDAVTYIISVTNKGPYDGKNVVLSDSAPAGVTFTGCSSTVGTCVWSPSGASLSLSSFTNGSTAAVTIQATLNFGVADGSTVTNTASVASTTFDPDTSNNAATASFKVLNRSDLFVSQSNTKLANRQLKYTVSVNNLGPYLAKQLVLNDAIPAGSKFVSINAGLWSCSAPAVGGAGTISCTMSSEALNAPQSITFTVKVTTPGSILVTDTASVSGATFDPNLANNSSTQATKVGP